MKAGLYTHIPFCRSKCSYCAFYSVSGRENDYRDSYLRALLQEADYFKKRYSPNRPIEINTWYVGGGTPSLLPVPFYAGLYRHLSDSMDFSRVREITLEANPEHLTLAYLRDLYLYTPVRRLSIGVQSFRDEDLQRLNRHHSGKEALRAVENARKAGFENITVDLIYGLRDKEEASTWKENLKTLQSLSLPHFSAYALTVEPNTVLFRKLAQGKIGIADEAILEREYFLLQEFASENGYEAYEISNYAKEGAYSVHNRNYWRNVPYIGLGASAHSYMENERHWNVSDVRAYMKDAVEGKQFERLTEQDSYHEYIMTALRTMWGVEKEKLEAFSPRLQSEFHQRAERQAQLGNLERKGDAWVIPSSRRLLTDGIAAEFF